MRVLLVEDDWLMGRSIELMLASVGFLVERAKCGEDGLDLGEVYDYDVIVLDVGLPDMSGLDVLRSLRRGGVDTPVLILSGESGIEVKVKALTLGADEYMTKPFHKAELIARLRAVTRRYKGFAQSLITIGDLSIDMEARAVQVNGAPIGLTLREYQTLELMALRKDKVITKEVFLSCLYGGLDDGPCEKIIDVFVCKLRKKLKPSSDGRHEIQTVWGQGYVLRATDEDGDPAQVPEGEGGTRGAGKVIDFGPRVARRASKAERLEGLGSKD